MKPVTQLAHDVLASQARGKFAIDATAGNGYDTEFLAQLVGPSGVVWAFDIQPLAVRNTAERLIRLGIPVELRLKNEVVRLTVDAAPRVIVIEADHADMANFLPVGSVGQVAAVMFNLGYLPGADKSCITRTASTLIALNASLRLLAPSGVLSVVVYPGHPGGEDEADAVGNWFKCRFADGTGVSLAEELDTRHRGPQLLALQRFTAGNAAENSESTASRR